MSHFEENTTYTEIPAGSTLKIVMVSRFGDCGLTDDMTASHRLRRFMAESAPKPMTNGEYFKILSEHAIAYRKVWVDQLVADYHMNELSRLAKAEGCYRNPNNQKKLKKWIQENIPQEVFDALLVDFINFAAGRHGMDYAMYARDLSDPKWRDGDGITLFPSSD